MLLFQLVAEGFLEIMMLHTHILSLGVHSMASLGNVNSLDSLADFKGNSCDLSSNKICDGEQVNALTSNDVKSTMDATGMQVNYPTACMNPVVISLMFKLNEKY